MNIKEFIKNNPYRVLGVATTDSHATLMSNNSRMKAFASIGKTVSFPQDYDRVFGEKPERHPYALASALTALSSPEGRLRHGMFWFMNLTATDAVALTVLAQTGNPMEARRIWERGEQDMSSVQNQMVCCLLMDSRAYAKAIQDAFYLYACFGGDFISTVCGGFNVITPDKLMPLFMEELVKVAEGDCRLWDKAVKRCNHAPFDGLWAEAKARPLLEKLQDLLNVAKSTERLTPQDHLDISYHLMNQTEPLLNPLKALCAAYPKLLSRYSTIADTIAEKVLDWEITYWNRTPWHSSMEKQVLPLLRFCYRYAYSVRFKNRCQENINIVLGRKKDARLFPNGMPDNLVLESDRKKRDAGISGILAAIRERNALSYKKRD